MASRTVRSVALVPLALILFALGGCAIKHPTADLVHGKQLFIQKCGVCHTLSHAGTKGSIGPNLDDAFRQDRADGIKTTSIEGLVDDWIQYPNDQGTMPAMIAACAFSFGIYSAPAAISLKPSIALWQTKNDDPRLTICATSLRYGLPLPGFASENSARTFAGAFLSEGSSRSFQTPLVIASAIAAP